MRNTVTSPTSFQVEANGINVIPEDQRHGTPRSLFWPWATSCISLFNVSIAGLLLVFGLGFVQAAIAAVLGTCVSFILVGQVSLAGKRASAPTMVISRAAFGIRGNTVPTLISYLTLVGWEIFLLVTTVLATTTVFDRLGWRDGTLMRVLVFISVIAIVIVTGVFGFRLVTRFQGVVTVASLVLVIAYIAMTIDNVSWTALTASNDISASGFIGAAVVAMAAFGIGWTNSAADYSRYLPRNSSGRAIVGWTTFAGTLVPSILVVYGLMLITSNPALTGELSSNPVGALISLLPTSYLILVPFLVLFALGMTGAGAMDLYSSGLTLLTLGLRVPRAVAAGLDGVIMTFGGFYLLVFAGSFFGPFEGFLILLGVPLAAWVGVFLADAKIRRVDYVGADLYDAGGRYGSVGWPALTSMIAATLVGWGLVVSSADAPLLNWQGYLFEALGVTSDSAWIESNIGVLVALLIGFGGAWIFGRQRIRRQEALAPQHVREVDSLVRHGL